MIALDIVMACALLFAFYVLACVIEAVATWAINGARRAWDAATVFEPTPKEREAWPDAPAGTELLVAEIPVDVPNMPQNRNLTDAEMRAALEDLKPQLRDLATWLDHGGRDVHAWLNQHPLHARIERGESSWSWAAFREFLTLCLEAAIFVGGLVAWGSILRTVWP